jgi:hypothetical protein
MADGDPWGVVRGRRTHDADRPHRLSAVLAVARRSRSERHRLEAGAAEAVSLEGAGHALGIEPGCPDPLERMLRAAPDREVRALEEAGTGIGERALERGHVRRGRHPRQPRLVEAHAPRPARHRHDRELHVDPEVVDVEARELARRHPVPHRNRIHAHEGGEPRVEHVALYDVTPDWIRPVEYQEGDTALSGGLHRERHRRHVGVVTGTDVQHVEEKDVDVLEHLGRRLARGSVERVDHHAGTRIDAALDDHPVLRIASDRVLRTVERDQIHLRVLEEPVDAGAAFAIDSGVVGDKPDAAPGDQVKRVRQEDFEAGPDALLGGFRALFGRPRNAVPGCCAAAAGKDQGERNGEQTPALG